MRFKQHTRTAGGALLIACAASAGLPGCAGNPSVYEAEKITVCHEGKTLVIPASVLTAHLGHGDERGPCE